MRKIRLVLVALVLVSCAGAWAQGAKPALLPPVRPQTVANIELLTNPGFEETDKGWRFSDWPPREKTSDRLIAKSVFYSQDVVHTGRQALCFDLTTVGPERLLGLSQGVSRAQLEPYEGRRLRLSAWLWVAKGPAYYGGDSNMRLWGDENTPIVAAPGFRLGGSQGEWQRGSVEFTLRLGSTRKADVNVHLTNVPDVTKAPVAFVDDVSLEVLADPPLRAELLCGLVVSEPDDRLPLKVAVSPEAFAQGLRNLRWDVTSRDGLRSYASGTAVLTGRLSLLEAKLPHLAGGEFAVRVAVGPSEGERAQEALIPFRRAAGPFGR